MNALLHQLHASNGLAGQQAAQAAALDLATLCIPPCNPMYPTLQPYVSHPAPYASHTATLRATQAAASSQAGGHLQQLAQPPQPVAAQEIHAAGEQMVELQKQVLRLRVRVRVRVRLVGVAP